MSCLNQLASIQSLFKLNLTPYQVLVSGFAGLILAGALLLATPWAAQSGEGTNFLDALFTATSAVCVTGLVVVDTGTHYSLFGQTVILLLIQFGGLGVMTVSTLLAVMLGKKIHLRERLLIQEATNQIELSGVVRLTLYIIKVTLLVEFIGGTNLAMRWYQDFGAKGIYYGYWHGVSAFCNAGFDLFGDFRSITSYVADPAVVFTIAGLIVVGGIGFTVIADVWNQRSFRQLSLHSKLTVSVSGLLIFLGMMLIIVFESGGKVFNELSPAAKVLAGFFQSVTTRTAGFSTVDIGSMREGTLLIIILLMYIGASPSSTGGGIKTTTAGIIAASVFGFIRGKKEVELFHRHVVQASITKAVTIAVISAGLIIAVTLAMTLTEQAPLLNILFEVTSAFGTVGLSTGITPNLSTAGKMMIIFTMFAGRVGSLTLVLSLALKKQNGKLLYPEGKVIIG
ncbi:TrkH family potassium uptake protein [Anaeroselena agilis]|uniref:TrkH family potassium uptake protein n=1 Tax=Anaeroselena agilis TaxID=3063788 RepID=A0ABU3NTH0_9FIRM|nr:TrkH family potassium uptake protein [Selenomonadales bacterium 4137-cl]